MEQVILSQPYILSGVGALLSWVMSEGVPGADDARPRLGGGFIYPKPGLPCLCKIDKRACLSVRLQRGHADLETRTQPDPISMQTAVASER